VSPSIYEGGQLTAAHGSRFVRRTTKRDETGRPALRRPTL